MPRRDLTEAELRELQGWARTAPVAPRIRDMVERTIGEIHELREREANARMMAGLEGAY